MKRRARGHPVRRLLFAGMVSVGVLTAGEIGARLVLEQAVMATVPDEQIRAHLEVANDLTYHPDLGWVRSIVPNPSQGIESHGLRHAEVSVARPEGRLRGFIMGDSQTYGAGVRQGEDYPAVAERTLQARGLDVEVLNASLSGYKSLQILRWFESELLAFDPQFLVVDAIPGDIGDAREVRPVPGAGLVAEVLFYSRLYRGLRLVVDELRPGARHAMRDVEPQDHSNHDLLMAVGEAHGVEVFFLDYPFEANPVMAKSPAHALPPGARVIEASKALLASGESTRALFHDRNHLTVLGNTLVGEAVADALEPCLRTLAAGGDCP